MNEKIFKMGRDAAKEYHDDITAAMYSDEEIARIAGNSSNNDMKFFKAGFDGDSKPIFVTGWRYGKADEDSVSGNYRDQVFEKGLSMMQVTGEPKASTTYEKFNAIDQPVTWHVGYLIKDRGADGEPLIIGNKALNINKSNKSYSYKSIITKDRLSSEAKAAHRALTDKTAVSLEALFIGAVKSFGQAQRKKVSDALRKHLGHNQLPAAAIKNAVNDVFTHKADELLTEKLTPCWHEAMKHGYELAKQILGTSKAANGWLQKDDANTEIDFSIYAPIFSQKVAARGARKVTKINETTKDALAKTLDEGVSLGESGAKLQDRIKETFAALAGDDIANYRARMIAQTETISSINEGQLLTYAGEGVERKEWISTMDDKTRDAHAAANGQIVAVDQPFIVDGDELLYPGDDSETSAENTINCRCGIAPVIGEATEDEGE